MERDILLLLIGLVAGAFVSLFLGYFVNLTTPAVGGHFATWKVQIAQKRALQSAEKAKIRIKELEEDLIIIRNFHNQPTMFRAFAFLQITDILRSILGLLGIGFVFGYLFIMLSNYYILAFIASTLILLLTYVAIKAINFPYNIFYKVTTLSEYEKFVQKQIAELQKVVKAAPNPSNQNDPL